MQNGGPFIPAEVDLLSSGWVVGIGIISKISGQSTLVTKMIVQCILHVCKKGSTERTRHPSLGEGLVEVKRLVVILGKTTQAHGR